MKPFILLGRIEGTSVLVLFFLAMPLKYFMGIPEAVRWAGSIHGVLFLMYVFLGVMMAREHKWPLKMAITGLILSSLPFGTFYFEKRYLPAKKIAPA